MAGSERGFTLVEVMVAVILTAVAIIGIVALYMSQARGAGYSRHTTEAATLAEDKLEQLFRIPSTCTPAPGCTTGNVLDPGNPLDAEGNSGTGGPFARSWTMSSPAGSTYYDLAVTVTWTEDVPKQVTLIGRRNL